MLCLKCKIEVSATPDNLDYATRTLYICPKCFDVLGIKYRKDTVLPKDLMNPGWNRRLKPSAVLISDDIYFSECKNEIDYLVLKLMQLKVKEECDAFNYFRVKEQQAGLLFNDKTYLGFKVWSVKEKTAIARQIYIVPEERRKGYGLMLMEYWVKNIADKVNEIFEVESPNRKSLGILIKLGYLKAEGEYIKNSKCIISGNIYP
jgi:GNAT superfamily N-acetyltransferase